MQIHHTLLDLSLHACKTLKRKNIVHHTGLDGKLTVAASENPLQASAKSPHLTKVGRITQHVHVEQLSQVVWSVSIGLSELCPDGCTLPLDDTPLLALCLCGPDGSDHLLQRYCRRHGSVCVCMCVWVREIELGVRER